jgi:hypothetical protein
MGVPRTGYIPRYMDPIVSRIPAGTHHSFVRPALGYITDYVLWTYFAGRGIPSLEYAAIRKEDGVLWSMEDIQVH